MHTLKLTVRDRAGNRTVQIAQFEIDASSALPVSLELGNNFPNPFNPETSIPLAIPSGFTAASGVRLVIYNAVGQRVRVLDADLASGRHTAIWNGRDDSGLQVSSGVYLYRLESASAVITRRMTLLK